MSVLSALTVKIGADSSGLRKELKGTKKEINSAFSTDPISAFGSAITSASGAVGSFINKFNAAATFLGSGLGLVAIISNAVSAGAAISDLSAKLQITTEEAGNFSRTIKLAGGDVDTAAAAIMRLDSVISGNSEAAQKTREILDAVGVTLADQNGKLLPVNEQLKNLAQGYQAATQAGYGQEFIMSTLGVRGMTLTETLMKYNDAAEDAAKIKGVGIDVNQMAEVDRQLQLIQVQLGQLTMAGGALLTPIVGEFLPALTDGLAETAQLIAENKDNILALGKVVLAVFSLSKVNQAIQSVKALAASYQVVAVEVEILTKRQEASIARQISALTAKQKKEEAAMRKEVNARKIAEAEKAAEIKKRLIEIEMAYAKTATKIRTEMTAAYQKINAEAKLSAAGQVQAAVTVGSAAQATGTKTVAASAAAKGAVGSLTKSVWALVGGWYAVAAAIAFAFEKLVEFKQQQAQEQGLTGGDIYSIDGQQYRRADDGKFYRRNINMDAEDAFDTYTETQVLEDDEISMLQAAYERKHPAYTPKNNEDLDTEKFKNLFGNVGGSTGGGKSSSGKVADPGKDEQKRRQEMQRSIEQEYSMRRTVNDAMRESVDLQAAYMSVAGKAAYEMQKEHEKAVEGIKSRWLQFETEYIGMSDAERARMVKNLEEVGAAFEITEEGRLSLAKQVAADIAAAEKQYDDEIIAYHTQCKDILAEIDDAFRLNSMEKLQESLTNETAAILNAYNTKQNMMQRYYDNWLITHQSTSEMVTNIVMDSQGSFENFFKNILTGAKSFNDSLMDLFSGLLDAIVKQIAEMMAAKVVNQFLNWIFPSFGFNSGGSVSSGGFNTYGVAANAMGISLGDFASGGAIIGQGSGTSDSIPAMLSNGEFVMSAAAVRRIGVPYLNRMNKGYANGGYVGGGASGANGTPPVIINLHNESGVTLDAQQTEANFDGENWVIGIVLNGIATNKNGMRTVLKGAMA